MYIFRPAKVGEREDLSNKTSYDELYNKVVRKAIPVPHDKRTSFDFLDQTEDKQNSQIYQISFKNSWYTITYTPHLLEKTKTRNAFQNSKNPMRQITALLSARLMKQQNNLGL